MGDEEAGHTHPNPQTLCWDWIYKNIIQKIRPFLFSILQVIVCVGFLAILLGTSVRLRHQIIWIFELWKWCVLMLVIVGGWILLGIMMEGVFFLTEKTFSCFKSINVIKYSYYIYGTKNHIRVLLWFISIYIAWKLLMVGGGAKDNYYSSHDSKILSWITSCLGTLLIAIALWVLRIFFVNLLASSILVPNRLFPKIWKSLIDHHILYSLNTSLEGRQSGPVEIPKWIDKMIMKPENRELQAQSLTVWQMQKIIEIIKICPSEFSAQNTNKIVFDLYSKIEAKAKDKRLEHEAKDKSEIEAKAAENSALEAKNKRETEAKPAERSELEAKGKRETEAKSAERSELEAKGKREIEAKPAEMSELEAKGKREIEVKPVEMSELEANGKSEIEAKAAEKSALEAKDKSDDGSDDESDDESDEEDKLLSKSLKIIFDKELGEFMVTNISGGVNPKSIGIASLRKWLVNAARDQNSLPTSLGDAEKAKEELNLVISLTVVIMTIIIWLILMGIITTQVLIVILTQCAALAFMFGDTAKKMFEGIVFVFVAHPFDVGDLCLVGNEKMVVKRICLLMTEFQKNCNDLVVFPNSALSSLNITILQEDKQNYFIYNSVKISIDQSTREEQLQDLHKKIVRFSKEEPKGISVMNLASLREPDGKKWFKPNNKFVFKEIEDGKLNLVLDFHYHKLDFDQDNFIKSYVRDALVKKLKRLFDEEGIKYHGIQIQEEVNGEAVK